jgi:hypothetical protein
MTHSTWTQLRAGLKLVNIYWQRWAAAPDRRRRRRQMSQLGETPASDEAALDPDALDSTGFSLARLDPGLMRDLLEAWQLRMAEVAGSDPTSGQRRTGKAFFREWLSDDALSRFPAFVAMALAQPVIASVARSMGQVPHLESIDVLESLPDTGAPVASQLWHYDVNDECIVKLFVYLEDCGRDNGPFTFIDAGPSQRFSSAVGHYVPDATIATHVPVEMWHSVEGPAGTGFLIDTGRCYHFGSRCSRRRVAYIATYSFGLKFMARARLWPGLLQGTALSPLQRAVCGMAE